MTKEEYKDNIAEQKRLHEEALKELAKDYVRANNPVSIGDTVTDHYQTIIVDRMGWWVSDGLPCATYRGRLLNKDGSVDKPATVYQSNMKSHVKKS